MRQKIPGLVRIPSDPNGSIAIGRHTHSGVGDAARERDAALLSATIGHVAVEVEVLVPVVRFLSAAALVLWKK